MVTITYSITVNASDTGDHRSPTRSSVHRGSNCATGSADPDCTVTIAEAMISVMKTSAASTAPVLPGTVVSYTISLGNSGVGTYVGATITDDLTNTLDDATYADDAAASGGPAPTLTGSTLAWTGDVPAGGTITITYSVTVNQPDTGDHRLANSVAGPPGSNCAAGSADPRCTTTDGIADLQLAKTASTALPAAGDRVTYTITATNGGTAVYPSATLSDDLSGVLDDAAYDNDAAASAGPSPAFNAPVLTWTGDIQPGQPITITYSVLIGMPPAGDAILDNSVLGPPGTNCLSPPSALTSAGRSSPARPTALELAPIARTCPGPHLPIRSLTIHKSVSNAIAAPGSTLTYTLQLTNTGAVSYDAASISDDLSRVLDDATYNDDARSNSAPAPSFSNPTLSWTGAAAVGQTVVITYTVTVTAPPTGDRSLINAVVSTTSGNSCSAANSGCEVTSIAPLSGRLPATGGDVDRLLEIAVGCTALGSLMVVVIRRRRRRRPPVGRHGAPRGTVA